MGRDQETALKAEELLRNPQCFYFINQDMDKGIKGEVANRLLTFLLEISSKTRDWAFVNVIGESAVGKTNLVRETLRYVPSKWWRRVGRLSRTAMDYLKDQDFDLLWIQEARGAQEAAPEIRLQSADDGGLTVWITERDKESGKFVTNEYYIRGRGVITTTTNVNFSPEDATRTWLESLDSSKDQTKLIIDHKLKRAALPPELLAAQGKNPEDLAPVVQAALETLDWASPVIIPYAEDLAKLFSINLVRARRDVDKFLGLIKITARVHQFQRPIVEINGKRFIIAAVADAYIAFDLGAKPLEETLTGLEKRLRDVYDAVKELVTATNTSVGVKVHKGSEYARRTLHALVEMGYVDVDESGKVHVYSVRQSENPSNDLNGLQRTFSGSEMQKKVDSFLIGMSSQPPAVGMNGYYSPIDGQFHSFDLPEVERTSNPSLEQPHIAKRSDVIASGGALGDKKRVSTAMTIENWLGWLRLEFQQGNNPVLRLTPLDPVEKGRCPICQHLSVNLCHQLQLLDGSRYDAICLDCGGRIQDMIREFEAKQT